MIILQHEPRGCCWTIPFIDSTASSRFIGMQQLKRIDAHILTQKGSHTSSPFFCISGQRRSRYSYSLIHILNNCSNVRNFRERQQHNIVIVIHSLHMVEVDQKVQNKILSRYFINAEAFFPFSDSYEHVCYPRALISLLNYECLNDTLYLSETPTSYYDIRDFWRKTRD
jgi:hypothetical protein